MTDKEYLELRNGTAQRFNKLPDGQLNYRLAEETLAFNGIFRPSLAPSRPSRPLSGGMSNLERTMQDILENADLPAFEQQHEPFKHLGRKHKLDFAWIEQKIALEVNGGAHAIKANLAHDAEKLFLLQREGWFVIFASKQCVENGAALARLKDVLEIRKDGK
jgi:very-short-patch-repair endonuclease